MKTAFGKFVAFATALIAVGTLAMSYFPASYRVAKASLQQPGLPLSLMFDSSILDANAQQLYQSMQDVINGYAITPADRTTYYSAVNNANGHVVNGWQGIITNVQQNANGYLVSIDVIPSLSSDTGSACEIVFDSDYSEQYQVFADSTFQYVGSLDPQGLAGQMPVIVGL